MCCGIGHYSRLQRFATKGYTLIEVLVAMAIFGSMLTLAGMALNQGLKQYQGLAAKGINFWNYAKEMGIGKSFHSMVDYYVYTPSDGWTPYFRGDREGVSYISLAPLAGTLPVIVWIRNEGGEDGTRSLVYYELPVYAQTYEEIDRNSIFGSFKEGKSVKVLEGVENVEFTFYGYDPGKQAYSWYSDFEGRKMKSLPSVVMVSYAKEGKKDKLVFETRVNSFWKTTYNELYQKR